MNKEEIDEVHIEHRGEEKCWTITMYLVPTPGKSRKPQCYANLVQAAEDILRNAKGLGKEWLPSYSEVMAWSEHSDRGVRTPDRLRVTLYMVTEEMEDNADAEDE